MIPLKHPAAYWAAQNIVLEAGRIGIETDTALVKIGNGELPWNDLAYYDLLNQFTEAAAAVANTYIAEFTAPQILGYFKGMPLRVLFLTTNIGASTINFNGFGAKAIKKSGTAALVAGDIVAGHAHLLIYDGINFQATTISAAGGGGPTGSGTPNRGTRWLAATVLGNATFTDDGTIITFLGHTDYGTAQRAIFGANHIQKASSANGLGIAMWAGGNITFGHNGDQIRHSGALDDPGYEMLSTGASTFIQMGNIGGSKYWKHGRAAGNHYQVRGILASDSSTTTIIHIDEATGNIGIRTITPDASAILDLTSTTTGLLPPRMTNAQRVAIAAPAIGLIVYCTDVTEGLYINKSTGWTFII